MRLQLFQKSKFSPAKSEYCQWDARKKCESTSILSKNLFLRIYQYIIIIILN